MSNDPQVRFNFEAEYWEMRERPELPWLSIAGGDTPDPGTVAEAKRHAAHEYHCEPDEIELIGEDPEDDPIESFRRTTITLTIPDIAKVRLVLAEHPDGIEVVSAEAKPDLPQFEAQHVRYLPIESANIKVEK